MMIWFALRCSLLKVLLVSTLLQLNLIAYTRAEGFVSVSCPDTTAYTQNSTFQVNLNNFFSGLSLGNALNNYFNNTKVGGNGPDAVYGQFLCRGDITIEVCRRCVQNAPGALTQPTRCPTAKEAAIWYDDKCMLRYSNRSFFGILATDPSQLLNSPNSVSNGDSLDEAVKGVFDRLISQAPGIVGPVKYFATRTIDFTSNLSSKLYHLVQCTPDLSSSDCGRCLSNALDNLNLTGYQGARVLSPSCNIRYESDPFYKETANSTAQPDSPTPPTESTANTNPSTRSPPPTWNGGLSAAMIVAIVVAVIVVSTVLFTVSFCLLRRKAKKPPNVMMDTTGDVDGNSTLVESLQYDLKFIKIATNNFSADNKIGEGGFGEVFKGSFNNGEQIAVKRLSKISGQGDQEFKNEVTVIAKLQHRNVVRLLGYCLDNKERILIYEFVPNKSLDVILFDQQKKQSLDWSGRYKIIVGVARGILYLHEDSRLRIIHRDLKASNVLLDSNMNAKISDFGMARIVGVEESQVNTSRVVGTLGYMPPEYIMNGQFSVKTDVFSFGVLVLEIISGKQNNTFYRTSDHLLSHAWKLWKDGKPLDLVYPSLGDYLDKNQVTRCIHMGLLCVQKDVSERPTMPLVVLMLGSSSMLLPTPHRPAFFLDGKMVTVTNPPEPGLCSANGVTITELYPR